LNFSLITKILNELSDRKRLLILQHKEPDGDSLGASLSMSSMFTRMGHRVSLILPDEVPEYLRFLSGVKKIRIEKKVFLKDFDGVILIEAMNFKRTGLEVVIDDFFGPVVAIDHHMEDIKDSSKLILNIKDVSSVSEIVFHFFKCLGLPIKKEEAIALFTGIYTDTGKFSEGNTTPQSLKIAGELMELGIDVKKVYQKLYGEKPLRSLKLLSKVLSTIKVLGKVGIIEVTKDMLNETGADMDDTKEFINYIRDIKGIEIAVFFREEKDGVRITFRSKKENVYRIAKKISRLPNGISGGGHFLAAGAFVKENLKEVKKTVLQLLKEWT